MQSEVSETIKTIFFFFTKSGQVIHTSAVEPVTPEKRETTAYKRLISDYNQAIDENVGLGLAEKNILEVFSLEGETSPEVIVDESLTSTVRVHGSVGQGTMDTDKVSADVSSGDTDPGWETARVTIPRGDGSRRNFVRRKKRDHEGNIIDIQNPNPILDTTVYEVEFEDGMYEYVSANVIAQALYENADENGFSEGLTLNKILDHFVSRKLTKQRSTKGLFLLVRWKEQSESVVRLADIKESYPIEIAKYVMKNGLEKEEGFWWVPYTLKKATRILAKIKVRNVRLEKFVIRVPRSVEEALEFDRQSRTSFWKDAIDKEMKNIEEAFKILEEWERAPFVYQFIRCHFYL